MRLKMDFRTGSKDNYKDFCKNYPDIELTYGEFERIIRTYNDELVKYVKETGFIVQLPYGLGSFGILKYKPAGNTSKEGRNIDFHNTRKLGKVVYHLNHHTEGYNFYFYWNPRYTKKNRFNTRIAYIKFANIWSFHIARNHSRTLAKDLKEDKSFKNRFVTRVTKKISNV